MNRVVSFKHVVANCQSAIFNDVFNAAGKSVYKNKLQILKICFITKTFCYPSISFILLSFFSSNMFNRFFVQKVFRFISVDLSSADVSSHGPMTHIP